MPFAIRFLNGTYLSSKSRGGVRRRKQVKTLNEATIFSEAGHAKLAFLAAIKTEKENKNSIATVIEIQYKVKNVEGSYIIRQGKIIPVEVK